MDGCLKTYFFTRIAWNILSLFKDTMIFIKLCQLKYALYRHNINIYNINPLWNYEYAPAKLCYNGGWLSFSASVHSAHVHVLNLSCGCTKCAILHAQNVQIHLCKMCMSPPLLAKIPARMCEVSSFSCPHWSTKDLGGSWHRRMLTRDITFSCEYYMELQRC